MSPTSDKVTDKYKTILNSNGITDEVLEVVVKDAGLQGEGFVSATQRVTVKFVNPKVKNLNLFVKVQIASPSHKEMVEEIKAFEKEARFLTDYVSAAKELCKSKGVEGFIHFYPKCYYGDETMIVLEDLVVDKGFELLKKEEMQDLEAARFALKTLAKHHALSYAMIEELGGAIKFFQRFPNLDYEGMATPSFRVMMEPALKSALEINIKILESQKHDEYRKAAAKLKTFLGKPFELMMNALKYDQNEKLLLLGHGDYWNNNMMFRRDPISGKIVDHVAIDLQVTRYNMPALDLTYYMFTSVKPEVRNAHFNDLLNVYLETLSQTSTILGHSINLTFEQLFKDFRRKLDAGFWMGMCSTCGPALTVLKDIDMTKVDIKDWANAFSSGIQKWLEQNREEEKKLAQQLLMIVKEYESLSLTKIVI